LKEVNEKITYIQAQLQQKIEPLSKVKTIRTNGLMIGIELHEVAGPFVGKLLQEGLLVLSAGEKVIRLLPPLVVTKQEIKQAVEKLETISEHDPTERMELPKKATVNKVLVIGSGPIVIGQAAEFDYAGTQA